MRPILTILLATLFVGHISRIDALDLFASNTTWYSVTNPTRTIGFSPGAAANTTTVLMSSTLTSTNTTLSFADESGTLCNFDTSSTVTAYRVALTNVTFTTSANQNDGLLQMVVNDSLPLRPATKINTFSNEVDTTTWLVLYVPSSSAIVPSTGGIGHMRSYATVDSSLVTSQIPAQVSVAVSSSTSLPGQLDVRAGFTAAPSVGFPLFLDVREMTLSGNGAAANGPLGGFLKLTWGVNAAAGTTTLIQGSATVLTNLTTTSCRIVLIPLGQGTGDLRIDGKTDGVGFGIISNNVTDDQSVYWQIWENSTIVVNISPQAPPSKAPSSSPPSPSPSPTPQSPPVAAPPLPGGIIAIIVIAFVGVATLTGALAIYCNLSGASNSTAFSEPLISTRAAKRRKR